MYNTALASEFFMRRKLQLNTYGTVAPRSSIQVFKTGSYRPAGSFFSMTTKNYDMEYPYFHVQWKFHESYMYATFSMEENNCNKSNFFFICNHLHRKWCWPVHTVKDDATWTTSLKNEMIEPVIH